MNLESVKAGDKVGVCTEWSAAIRTVVKRTDTQLVLSDDSRWTISRGRKIGSGAWGSEWLATVEDAQQKMVDISEKNARKEMVRTLRDTKWSDMSDERLTKFITLLKETT